MKFLVSLGLRAVLGLDLAIAGLIVFAPSAAMAIPFPPPVFTCEHCTGCTGITESGCPGAGKCGTAICICERQGPGSWGCSNK